MAQAPVRSTIRADFQEHFAESLTMNQRARTVIPSGITVDGRNLKPFPVYVTRARGSRKWTVDGHELIDFAIGHGSLILGHNDPDVIAAARAALEVGTHHGAGHEGEILWGEQIRKLVPSAEQVRFTGSGTESTMLAVRLARAATGKSTIVKFYGHFHGWNDYLLKGERPPFATAAQPGIPQAVLDTIDLLPNNDPDALNARLARGDVAGVILEPSGASWGTVPVAEGYLQRVRDLTTKHGVVLIFDEVITGFRWSPGGAQARFGVIPELTTMAKIVAGGFPGGAVAGRHEVMQYLAFKDEPGWNTDKKIRHQGTFNASPVVSAAAVACLRKCENPAVQQRCDELAARLRTGFNGVLDKRSAPGFVWGESSVFHISLGKTCANFRPIDLGFPEGLPAEELKRSNQTPLYGALHISMLLEGVDLFSGGGMLSVAHTDKDVDAAIVAFDNAIERMADEKLFTAAAKTATNEADARRAEIHAALG